MTTTINASTSAGLIQTADTSGVLALQTAGTTALSIDASQNVSFTNQPTYSGGTANGVAYLNGSKVLTTGSALVFDGTNLGVGVTPVGLDSRFKNVEVGTNASLSSILVSSTNLLTYLQHNSYVDSSGATKFKYTGGSNYASQYNQNNGSHVWQSSTAAGTGGNACTFTTNMTLDSAGNLGLGVTPSAWQSGFKAIQLSGLASWNVDGSTAGSATYFGNNVYRDSTNTRWQYLVTGDNATQYLQASGQHIWRTAASGTAGNAITFTQAMTLDASGNLGVGNTSPGSFARLTVQDSGSGAGTLALISSAASNAIYIKNTGTSADFKYNDAYPMTWSINGTERMRLDSSGNLLVGTTSKLNGSVVGLQVNSSDWATTLITSGAGGNGLCALMRRSASTGEFIAFQYTNTPTSVGSINTNGTSTTYGTSSDYRLKNTIVPMTGALAKVALLKPCTYKWNADDSDGEGFIAHELAEVCPNAVTGEKDAVNEDGSIKPQSIDTSFLVATLTAAIQEQQTLIQTLTDRITALENK